MKTEDRKKLGKKTRKEGKDFEARVRSNLSEEGWTVCRFDNDVKFVNSGSISDFIHRCKTCGTIFSFLADYNGQNAEEIRRSEERIIRNIREHDKTHKIEKIAEGIECQSFGNLVQAKTSWRRTPHGMFPMNLSPGFPDFIAYKHTDDNLCRICTPDGLDVMDTPNIILGVECKTNGTLDKLEKQKCQWLLSNNIFSKILIASKHKIKNRIHIEYKEYGRF